MTMNEDLKKYPVVMLYKGKFHPAQWIQSTEDYNHYIYHLHHFVKQQEWKRNKEKLEAQGIEQKLILMPVQCHLDLHNCLSNFEKKWGISRKELLYGAKNG